MKFIGNFNELKEKLKNLSGSWDDTQVNKKVFRLNDGGLLNWYVSTGTIQFQGKSDNKEKLEEIVVIDTTTTTQQDVENNTIHGKIYVKPTKTIEFVSLDFIV